MKRDSFRFPVQGKHSVADEEDEPNQVEGAWLSDEDLAAQEEDTVVRGRV